MLRKVGSLKGSTLSASDGEIGTVEDCYFDDQAWAIRYLVIDTGGWLSSRKVLISPHSVTPPLGDHGAINVSLTREKVKMSPDIDTHKPVSRRLEREYLGYYGFPSYWSGEVLGAMGAYPGAYTMIPLPTPSPGEIERAHQVVAAESEDVHLRSTEIVTGYDLQARDDSIGHIEDFLFDDETWVVRYLVIDTRNWWPGGKRVLIATHWIDRIDWADQKVFTTLTRESVKAAPAYDDSTLVDRDYESRLHDSQGRKIYWV